MNKPAEKNTSRIHALRPIMTALLVAGAVTVNHSAKAALTIGTMLEFTSGAGDGTSAPTGSWFGMDQSGEGNLSFGERTVMTARNPIVIGVTSVATGSHNGSNNGTESPASDIWEFFGNTGMDYSDVAAAEVITGTTSNTRKWLDFSGWTVTWNGIADIPMNAGPWTPGNTTASCTFFYNGGAGIARIRCPSPATDCSNGVAFDLDYCATVPIGDPSGFGNVKYQLHLEGTVRIPGALTTDATSISAGSTATAVGSPNMRLNTANLTAQSIPLDTLQYAVSIFYDFNVTTATGSANVVIPLSAKIPASPIWRIVNPSTGVWRTFVENGSNAIKSAAGTPDACPAAGNAAYTAPPTPGHYCLQLTIQDNGPNDNNATSGTISDPGGITTGTPVTVSADTRSGSNSGNGCSLNQKPVKLTDKGDWLAIFGLLAWLGMLIRRRARAE